MVSEPSSSTSPMEIRMSCQFEAHDRLSSCTPDLHGSCVRETWSTSPRFWTAVGQPHELRGSYRSPLRLLTPQRAVEQPLGQQIANQPKFVRLDSLGTPMYMEVHRICYTRARSIDRRDETV